MYRRRKGFSNKEILKKILTIWRIIDDIIIEVFRYDLNMEYERVINET